VVRYEVPLTPEWATFFSAELAALAALAGFVVVAISINLARILSYPHLPTRAGEALIGPVGAITATSLALIPGQPAALPGAEVIAVGLVIVIAPIAFQSRTWGLRKEAVARERIVRAATNEGFNLTFLSGARSSSPAPPPASTGSPPATSSASLRSCLAPGC